MGPYGDQYPGYGALQHINCYGVVMAGIKNDPNESGFLNREKLDILNTLECTPEEMIMPKELEEKLRRLANKPNKLDKFAKEHLKEIYKYLISIQETLEINEGKILVIEFLDDKKRSQHVAFITPEGKVYDKINIGKYNLGNEINQMFDFWIWTGGSKFFKLYILDENQTQNVKNYINYLILQEKVAMNNKLHIQF